MTGKTRGVENDSLFKREEWEKDKTVCLPFGDSVQHAVLVNEHVHSIPYCLATDLVTRVGYAAYSHELGCVASL